MITTCYLTIEPRYSRYGNLTGLHPAKVTSRRPKAETLDIGSIVIKLKLDIPTALFVGRDFETDLVVSPDLVLQTPPVITQEDAHPEPQ